MVNKLAFRLLSVGEKTMLLVPEHQVQFLEQLKKVRYKDCHLVQGQIDEMTNQKTVIHLEYDEWAKRLGQIYVPPNGTTSSQIPITTAAAFSIRKQNTEVPTTPATGVYNRKQKAEEFIGGVLGNMTYNVGTGVRVREYVESDSDETDVTDESDDGDDGDNVGDDVGDNVGDDVGGPETLMEKIADNVMSADEPVVGTGGNTTLSVVVDSGKGMATILIYLGGMHIIDVCYQLTKTSSATSLTAIYKSMTQFRNILFRNPLTEYVVQVNKFYRYYRAVGAQERALEEFLDDAKSNKEITDESYKLWNTAPGEYMDILRTLGMGKTDKRNAVLLSGYGIKEMEQFFTKLNETPDMTPGVPLWGHEDAAVGRVAGLYPQFSQYIREIGEYSSKTPESGVPNLMNYVKIIKRYRGDVWGGLKYDFSAVVRMVYKHTGQNDALFTILQRLATENIDGIGTPHVDFKEREFRRQMITALCMSVLMITPTIKAAYNGLGSMVALKRSPGFVGRFKKAPFSHVAGGVLKMGDLFMMSSFMITSCMHLSSLASTKDGDVMKKTFGDVPMSHYYQTSLYQMMFSVGIKTFPCVGGEYNTMSACRVATAIMVLNYVDNLKDPETYVGLFGYLSPIAFIYAVDALFLLYSVFDKTRKFTRGVISTKSAVSSMERDIMMKQLRLDIKNHK
jgi:hypothetical protein